MTLNNRIRQVSICEHIRGIFIGVIKPFIPKGGIRGSSAPQFGPLYLYLHCLTQNDQIRRGNIYGEGSTILGGQQHACIRAGKNLVFYIFLGF